MKFLRMLLGFMFLSVVHAAPPPQIAWKIPLPAYATFAPAVDGKGRIWFGSSGGPIFRADSSGSIEWKSKQLYRVHGGILAQKPSRVLFAAFDRGVGEVLNEDVSTVRFTTVDHTGISVGSNGVVYSVLRHHPVKDSWGGEEVFLHALKPNHETLWWWAVRGFQAAKPVIGKMGHIYFSVQNINNGSGSTGLISMTPDGAVLWQVSDISTAPAIGDDGTLYAGSLDGTLAAIDQAGRVQWRVPVTGGVANSPVIDREGTIYCGTGDGYAAAISKQGVVLWYFETEGTVFYCGTMSESERAALGEKFAKMTRPEHPALGVPFSILSSGQLLIPLGSKLVALGFDGRKAWESDCGLTISSPLTVDRHGKIYFAVRNPRKYEENYLVCVSGESPLQDSSWPSFARDPGNSGRADAPLYPVGKDP